MTLNAILTPNGEQAEVSSLLEANKSQASSEAVDAKHEGSYPLKIMYVIEGLVLFAAGVTMLIVFLAMAKHYDVRLGSSLPNLGERYSLWNLPILFFTAMGFVGLCYSLSAIGCFWTPAMVSLYDQRVATIRAVISTFSWPALLWVTCQVLGMTNVVEIVQTVMCRLAVVGFQKTSEMYNRWWMDSLMSENPSVAPGPNMQGEVAYSLYSEGFAFFFLVGAWWPPVLYGIELWAAHQAPLATVQVIVPAIANHFWVTPTTIFVGAILDLLGVLIHIGQYMPDYLNYKDGDNTWKSSAAQYLRSPLFQEGFQVSITFILEVYFAIVFFVCMYGCVDGVTTC